MKIKLKIRHKIQLYILSTTILIYAGALGFISFKSKTMAYSDAKRISDNYAVGAASQVQIFLETYLTTVKDLSNIFKTYKEIDENNRRSVLSEIMKKTLESNKDFLSVWSILETNSIDNLDNSYKNKVGSTILGNFRYIYYKDGNQIKLSEYIEQDPAEVLSGRLYTRAKLLRKEIIEDPYFYSYSNNTATEVSK
jgi:methyl-accepting chemotaxis protein